LRWNKITNKGGFHILNGLESKENLAVLDLSYNTLGERREVIKDTSFIHKLSSLIPKLKLLRHLDLSCNGFDSKECKSIGYALEKNHSLFGFHFSGNFYGSVDEKGFLVVEVLKDDEKKFNIKKL